MSNNKLGLNSIEHISNILRFGRENIDLRVIKLENSNITDPFVAILMQNLILSEKPRMLIELSLANNSLSDIAADKIAHFLEFE